MSGMLGRMGRDYDQVRKQLAHNIRTLRVTKGLSQEALALKADIDRTYISQIERSIGNPSLLVLCKLASILGSDVIELMSEAQ